MEQISTILRYMQRHDPNGFWLEWLEEIAGQESSFDKEYVLETIEKWFYSTNDEAYKNMYNTIQKL